MASELTMTERVKEIRERLAEQQWPQSDSSLKLIKEDIPFLLDTVERLLAASQDAFVILEGLRLGVE